jgi:hypothetical protein
LQPWDYLILHYIVIRSGLKAKGALISRARENRLNFSGKQPDFRHFMIVDKSVCEFRPRRFAELPGRRRAVWRNVGMMV